MKKKKGTPTITLSELYRRFGRRAEVVLADYLSLQPRKKGEQRTFQIRVALPTGENYTRMEAQTFRKPMGDQIKEAYAEMALIRDELEEWFQGMPKGFQVAAHGKQIKASWDKMDDVVAHEPPIPKDVKDIPVMFVPEAEESLDGRPEKRDNAVNRLKACVDALAEEDENHKFIAILKKCVKDASAVKFPSMFT